MKCSVAATEDSGVNSIRPSSAFKSWRKMCDALEPAQFPSVYLFVSWEHDPEQRITGSWRWSVAKTPSVQPQPSTRWHTHSRSRRRGGSLLGSWALLPPARYLLLAQHSSHLIQFILASRLGRRWRGINAPETQPTWEDTPSVGSFWLRRGELDTRLDSTCCAVLLETCQCGLFYQLSFLLRHCVKPVKFTKSLTTAEWIWIRWKWVTNSEVTQSEKEWRKLGESEASQERGFQRSKLQDVTQGEGS